MAADVDVAPPVGGEVVETPTTVGLHHHPHTTVVEHGDAVPRRHQAAGGVGDEATHVRSPVQHRETPVAFHAVDRPLPAEIRETQPALLVDARCLQAAQTVHDDVPLWLPRCHRLCPLPATP